MSGLVKSFSSAYHARLAATPPNTARRLRAADTLMLFCVATMVVLWAYKVVATTAPFTAYLAAMGAAAGCFVLTASYRLRLTSDDFEKDPRGALVEWLAALLLLFVAVVNYLP